MSRIGRKIIIIPEGIKVDIEDKNLIKVRSSDNILKYHFNPLLNISVKENLITISRPNNDFFMKKIHGTTRALLANMILGLKNMFIKKIEIVGIGFDVNKESSNLVFNLGFSHKVYLPIMKDIQVEIIKNKEIIVKGFDKQMVGEFSAKILKLKKPEPYKGKGIRLVGQYIHRKSGKSNKK
ncbi:MAG: 50S ribosomal protein L6 [Candidatus Phytoplasma cynodontis]|uniref:50S ribosomal protein L6 n=1 Tax='Cynodon dactylon' phytoplasma TaxID=295320 RepID=UPI001265B880|nr:50S ribosomal protein L6 ['Cynodon dactylon' phytoplasma]KAB8121972.1 50S ribosomal protein L6 ['Cynodon dactylon' phytoplasma]WIA07614.1 MAG: 50S ribosomal protein L6 [Candidatus Phytoplasma cynodontis]